MTNSKPTTDAIQDADQVVREDSTDAASDIADLFETQARLRASEERMAYAFAATREGLWDWSIPDDRVDHNEQWGRIFGLKEVPPSHPVSFFADHIHPDDRAAVMARVGKALETDCDYDSEHRILWPDGRVLWVHDRGRVVVRDAEGRPLRMAGSIRDVTERKQAELALVEAKMAAEAANIAKSRFLATMSHEIRTPLNGVLGMAQLLLEPNLAEDERRECARTILHSGQTLLTLLNDILDLSKVEAGKLELLPGMLEPDALLHETHLLFADTARTGGLAIESAWTGPALARYRGDPHRVRQMLSNLVSNAIKFSSHGCIRMEGREIARDAHSALLEFSVADSGIGIPADKVPLLFRPFSQVDSSLTRQFGGTGLGLSIVRSLAELMGGSVGVDSREGEGSRFWFRVRAAALEPGTDTRHAPRETTAPLEEGTSGGMKRTTARILVAEDNPTNQLVVKALLRKLGMEVVMAADGKAAVDLIEAGEPCNLVLMDLHMPVPDGLGATERIRQRERALGLPRLPIIALTADVFPEERERCLARGMDGFLPKPIVAGDLAATLHAWIAPAGQEGSR